MNIKGFKDIDIGKFICGKDSVPFKEQGDKTGIMFKK